MKRVLESKKCLKLICGAGNENLKEIEKLSFIYSSCGFNMIDVCAKLDALKAAKRGIKRAGRENETAICVSIGIQDDIHMQKAVIDRQKCSNCLKCESICEQNAVYFEDEKTHINDKKCIGCAKCADVCAENAVLFEHKYKSPHEMLLPMISEDIDCVEFHCSIQDENRIIDAWNKIKSIYKGCLGVCLDRSKSGDIQIINLLKKFISEKESLIIQADGKPMTGGSDDLKSSLQAVSFAELIRSAGIDNFLILSGGTNSKTSYLAKISGVDINGVALGSFARKIVRKYLSEDFFFSAELQNAAIKQAKISADNLLMYM